jgi:hypothetical protein
MRRVRRFLIHSGSSTRSAPLTRTAAGLLGIICLVACQSAETPPADHPETPATTSGSEGAAQSTLGQRLTATGEGSGEQRAQAVEQAIAEYDVAARNGTTSEPARAFVREYAAALTRVAVENYGQLPPKTRQSLINLLVSFDVPQTSPAFAAALTSYAKTKQDTDSAIWAARGAAKQPSPEIAAALVQVWQALDMSDKDCRRLSAHLSPALRANARAEWVPFLGRALSSPLERPARFDDKPAVKVYQNQLYWQNTAAELLGQLRAKEHVRTLFQTLLDPSKHEVHPNAELGLIKMGDAALPTLEALLEGTDAELVAQAGSAVKMKEPAIYFATKIADQLRLPGSAAALRRVWARVDDPIARTLLIRSESLLPGANVTQGLKATFTSSKLSTTLPEGDSALEVLADAATNSLQHAELVPWLTERVDKLTGAGSRKGDVQRGLVEAISELAFPDEIKKAQKVAQLYGGRTGTPMFEQASALLASCGVEVACYRARVTQVGDAPDQAFGRVKAVLMLGMLSGTEERALIAQQLASPVDREFLRAALRVIEYFTPARDEAIITELSKALKALPESNPPDQQVTLIQRTLDRLNAR